MSYFLPHKIKQFSLVSFQQEVTFKFRRGMCFSKLDEMICVEMNEAVAFYISLSFSIQK